MKLDSVRSLKHELTEPPALPRVFARAVGARARAGGPLAARADGAHTRAVGATHMAMGVSRGRSPGDFRLSVRIQARGARGRLLAEAVRRRSRGEADIRFTPRVVRRGSPPPSWFRRRRRPLEPGLSIGQGPDVAGTLGAIAEDTHAFYVLSNNHVLADVNRAEPGSPVSQPGDLDRDVSPRTLIGVLDRFVPMSFSRSNLVDCAVAEIFADLEFSLGRNRAVRVPMRPPDPVSVDDLDLPVAKAGRTTGVTRGTIQAVEVDRLRVDMSDAGDGSLIALFSDQIEVAGDRGRPFSAAGDSGALVLDLQGHPRALLFSGGLDEGTGQDLTWANRIETALGKLGVTLVV
jgi:hypothetical protein